MTAASGPPIILDAALVAVRDALKGQCDRPSQSAVEAVTAVWPHAGAAWLRWAADSALPRDRSSGRPMHVEQIRDWLRRLADEAEGQP